MKYVEEVIRLIPELYNKRQNGTNKIFSELHLHEKDLYFKYKGYTFLKMSLQGNPYPDTRIFAKKVMTMYLSHESDELYINNYNVNFETEDDKFQMLMVEPLTVLKDAITDMKSRICTDCDRIELNMDISTEMYNDILEFLN